MVLLELLARYLLKSAQLFFLWDQVLKLCVKNVDLHSRSPAFLPFLNLDVLLKDEFDDNPGSDDMV